jgi:hypothetical protein
MRVKEILFNPTETFRDAESEGLEPAFKQLLVLAVIFAVGSGITTYLTIQGLSGFLIISTIVGTYILTVVGVILGALIIHIFVYLFGGRQGIEQTLKANMYAVTPSLLLGWIPLINIIAGFWALVLTIIGIRELQKMSTGRAIAAVLTPIILLSVIAAVLVWMLVTSVVSASFGMSIY